MTGARALLRRTGLALPRRTAVTLLLVVVTGAAQERPTAPVSLPARSLQGETPSAARAAQERVPPGELLRLGIDDAVALALERSRDLRDAGYGLTEAKEQVSEVWGQALPQVSWSARYARAIAPAVSFVPARAFDRNAPEDEFVALQFGADNAWQSSVTVEQALFDPGLIVGLGAAARFRNLQVETVRGRAQQVATRVRVLCYDLLLRREEVRLTERSLERVREALAESRARRRAGMATDYDVLRLRVELANLEPELLRTRNAVRSTRRQLALELDLPDPRRLHLDPAGVLADTTRLPDPPSAPPTALIDAALAQRSDVLQLGLTTLLRRAQLRREQADYLPTVSLFGSWDVQAQQNGSPNFFGNRRSRATSKIAGVQVRLPLFTGLQRDARIDQRRAALRQVETQLQLLRDRAAAEVQDLAESVAESVHRERAQRLAVRHAAEGHRIALAAYSRGMASQLQLTDAEVALRQSELNHARAVHDVYVTRARLDLAMGRVPPVDATAEAP